MARIVCSHLPQYRKTVLYLCTLFVYVSCAPLQTHGTAIKPQHAERRLRSYVGDEHARTRKAVSRAAELSEYLDDIIPSEYPVSSTAGQVTAKDYKIEQLKHSSQPQEDRYNVSIDNVEEPLVEMASKSDRYSPPSGAETDDYYDVYNGKAVVGRGIGIQDTSKSQYSDKYKFGRPMVILRNNEMDPDVVRNIDSIPNEYLGNTKELLQNQMMKQSPQTTKPPVIKIGFHVPPANNDNQIQKQGPYTKQDPNTKSKKEMLTSVNQIVKNLYQVLLDDKGDDDKAPRKPVEYEVKAHEKDIEVRFFPPPCDFSPKKTTLSCGEPKYAFPTK